MQAASPGELPVKEGDLVTVTLPDVGQGWSQVPLIVMVMLGVVVVWVKEGDRCLPGMVPGDGDGDGCGGCCEGGGPPP